MIFRTGSQVECGWWFVVCGLWSVVGGLWFEDAIAGKKPLDTLTTHYQRHTTDRSFELSI
jgi:hypothetical protein